MDTRLAAAIRQTLQFRYESRSDIVAQQKKGYLGGMKKGTVDVGNMNDIVEVV